MPAHRLAPPLVVFAGVALLAFSEGGYFPVSWGWSSLGFLLVVVSVLFVRGSAELSRPELVYVAALGLFVTWVAVSAAWSESVPRTVLESERDLVYVAGVAALLSLASARGHVWVLGGVFAATVGVCGYALSTRLFPDRFGLHFTLGNRLAEPIGYWNGLGLLAAMGALSASGLAAHARSWVLRACAASATLLLVPTLYFTTSRGAWIALAAGTLVALVLDPRRLQLAATAVGLLPLLVLAVLLASRSENLAGIPSTVDPAAAEGHRLAAVLAALALVAAFVPRAVDALRARLTIGARARRISSRSLIATAVALSVAAVVAAGGPRDLVGRAYDSFRGPVAAGGKLDERLLTFSGNGRSEYWRVAWNAYRDHPWAGSGAGTYELHWYQERPSAFGARDAHNLYLETLAETGPVGLLLLVLALATPFLALRSQRRDPLVVSAIAAYVAFLVHASLDWDWELPAVTLVALFAGAVALLAARADGRPIVIAGSSRAATFAVAAALGAAAFAAQVGNARLAAASSSLGDGRYFAAIREARSARRWLPWDSEPWRLQGEAQLARRSGPQARASLKTAIEKDPRDWRLWYGLALATTGRERFAAAARARTLNPREPGIDDLTP